MPYKNKYLSDYSDQQHLPLLERTDWKKIPDVIKTQTKMKPGAKPSSVSRKNKNGFVPEEVKIEAVAMYAALGSVVDVANAIGVSYSTVRTWMSTEWWNVIMLRVQNEDDDKLDAKFTKILDKAVNEINDRLENGEYVYNTKTGETVRVKPKMRDISTVLATHVDKRALLRGKPTSITAKVSTNEVLDKLAKEFSKFSKATEITPDA